MKKHNTPVPELASEKELSEFLLNNFNSTLTQAIKTTVSLVVKAEMKQLREDLGNPPQMSFNGYYNRHLVSPAGKVENIPIARFRGGNTDLPLNSLQVFGSEKNRLYELVQQLHLAGISQRKINKFCKEAFGKAIAPKTTKILFEELLKQEEFKINETSLINAPMQYIFCDGVWQKVKNPLTGQVEDRVIMAVMGMDEAGNKQILGFKLGHSETESLARELLESLIKRGLDIDQINLVITDESKGILSAVSKVLPETKVQLCLVHRYRNVMKHTPVKHKKEMGRDLHRLTQSESRDEFTKQVKDMQKRWQVIAPKAVRCLARTPELLTAYFDFDQVMWSKLRTTNGLERTFREVRARTVVNQHQFTSPTAADKYHQAIFGNLNQNYFNAM
jgi:putative transposase